MFERYTETARRVIVSSKHKAALLGCHEIETDTYCWTCYRKIRLLKLPFLSPDSRSACLPVLVTTVSSSSLSLPRLMAAEQLRHCRLRSAV
jgi:hypothetical protein